MRDSKEFQVWKEECLTSLNVDDMDEIDEELFLLNKKCEKINKIFFEVEDWMDVDAILRSNKIDDEDVFEG